MKGMSKIYKDAAKRVDERTKADGDHFPCCPQILTAVWENKKNVNYGWEARILFSDYFLPPNKSYTGLWFGECDGPDEDKSDPKLTRKLFANKEHRVMSLLMMAEIAKDLK